MLAISPFMIISAEDVVRRRGYSDPFVTMCMCVCMFGCVCQHDKSKTADRNALKLGTTVIVDTVSKPIYFESKWLRLG